MTDGEAKLFRTVRLNIVDSLNGPEINNGVEMLQRSGRGSWLLVHTLEKEKGRGDESKGVERTG